MKDNEIDFLSVKEFAVKLGVHANTVRKLIKKGRINALQTGSGKYCFYRIPRTELNRLAYDHLEKVVEHMVKKKVA